MIDPHLRKISSQPEPLFKLPLFSCRDVGLCAIGWCFFCLMTRQITCSQLMGFCRRLLKRLTSQEGAGGGGGGGTPPVSGPPSRDRRNSGAADTSTQRLMLAQRQFHGHLIDYELIFAQVVSVCVKRLPYVCSVSTSMRRNWMR